MIVLGLFLVTMVTSLMANEPPAENTDNNLETMSGGYQGDILLPPGSDFRNAKVGARKWTNGIVPYDASAMSDSAKTKIKNALKELEDAVGSCIKFKERTNENNYVRIVNGNGCSSYVGMYNGGQVMNLKERGCLGTETIQHEFLHAMGFQHEQSRSDRDKYIRILWENISPSMKYNFNKGRTNNQGLEYDYKSVMQYGRNAFSNNGRPTMELIDGTQIAWRNMKLTEKDIKMVQLFYGCSSGGGDGGTNGGNGGDGGGSDNCIDKTESCSSWVQYCNDPSYKAYMERNCPKSCNLCGSGGGGSESCKDKDQSCPGWQVYCNNNQYVKENCKKTCRTC